MKELAPIPQKRIMERIGAWLQDEYGYQRYVRSVKDFNYKVMVGQINHNNSYLGYVFNILLYYQFGKQYMNTDEKFVEFLELKWKFEEHPYTTVSTLYDFYSSKGAIPYEVHQEIMETLQWLIEPYDRAYDEYDKFHVGPYCRAGKEWINAFYEKKHRS